MGAPNRPRQGEKIVKADWVSRAVNLAIKGWSVRKIAKQVGRAPSTVHEALQKELEDRRPTAEKVEEARSVMREQVQSLLKAWLPRAIDGLKARDFGVGVGEDGDATAAPTVAVDEKAANLVFKCFDRLAKLDGLDAANRTELTGKDGAALEVDVHALLADRIARLSAASGAGDGNPEPESGGSD
jgi:hypothetical protein